MATTSSSALRYPASSDSPNIAQYFQNLASDVDQKVSLIVANPSARTALTGTYAMQTVKETSTGRIYMRNLANSGWDYAGGAPPPIVLATVFSGWTAVGGQSPAVYKDGSGLIHVAGVVTNDSAYNPQDGLTHTVITLPSGYRPGVAFSCALAIGLSQPIVVCSISTAGVLSIVGGTGSSVGTGVGHQLTSIPPFHPGYVGGALS